MAAAAKRLGEELVELTKRYQPLSVVADFIDRGADINVRNETGDSVLSRVAEYRNNVKVIKLLLKNGANIDNLNLPFEHSVLHISASFGRLEACKLFIELKPSLVNQLCKETRSTPLHQAAGRGCLAVCKLLLEKGVDAALLNSSGETACDLAETWGHVETVALLKKHMQLKPAVDKAAVSASQKRNRDEGCSSTDKLVPMKKAAIEKVAVSASKKRHRDEGGSSKDAHKPGKKAAVTERSVAEDICKGVGRLEEDRSAALERCAKAENEAATTNIQLKEQGEKLNEVVAREKRERDRADRAEALVSELRERLERAERAARDAEALATTLEDSCRRLLEKRAAERTSISRDLGAEKVVKAE